MIGWIGQKGNSKEPMSLKPTPSRSLGSPPGGPRGGGLLGGGEVMKTKQVCCPDCNDNLKCQTCDGTGLVIQVIPGQLVTGWDIKDAALPLPTSWPPAGYDENGDQLFEVPRGVYL